jgi:hypothetical protein
LLGHAKAPLFDIIIRQLSYLAEVSAIPPEVTDMGRTVRLGNV